MFICIEYDLHKVIKSNPELLRTKAIRTITYQMLLAVKYLHSADIIHRDLKVSSLSLKNSVVALQNLCYLKDLLCQSLYSQQIYCWMQI